MKEKRIRKLNFHLKKCKNNSSVDNLFSNFPSPPPLENQIKGPTLEIRRQGMYQSGKKITMKRERTL